jgi:hypothetical protein
MKWITRELVHFDRLVSPWLILRFIDEQAEFSFLPLGEAYQPQEGVTAFALPGAELSEHDARGPVFSKIKRRFGVKGAAIDRMEDMVTQGVDYLLKNKAPEDSHTGRLVVGVMAFAEGLMMTSENDHQAIERALPLFDALYAQFQAEEALAQDKQPRPPGVGEPFWGTVFVNAVAAYRRRSGKPIRFNDEMPSGPEFQEVLARFRGMLSKR